MTTTTLNPPSRLILKRWPQDPDELHLFTEVVFGVTVPRQAICPGHTSPFDALAEAFFAEHPVTIWHGSRGFGGKSFTLALLSVLEATILTADVTILGGSGAQSMRVYEHMLGMWHHPLAPRHLLDGDPTRYVTRFRSGNTVVALMASQGSVRGPHPQRLRMDEIDEMDPAIFEAAQGQPMEDPRRPGVATQTVASSTWQYPDKTMAQAMRRAAEKGWPVRTWCYKETGNPVDGWLTPTQVERKRAEVSTSMWEVEYDLQEPSFEGRAIDGDAVDRYFDPALGTFVGALDEHVVLAEPVPGGRYVTGIDWAKAKDWTVIRTFRVDLPGPWQEVAFLRTGRRPWPEMVDLAVSRWQAYGGQVWHDATGLGAVVDDYLPSRMKDAKILQGVQMVGRAREELFSEYISAIEHDDLRTARIEFAYGEHKYASQDDFRPGRTGHPPDSCVAGALAWMARHKADRYTTSDILVEDFARDSSPWEGI